MRLAPTFGLFAATAVGLAAAKRRHLLLRPRRMRLLRPDGISKRSRPCARIPRRKKSIYSSRSRNCRWAPLKPLNSVRSKAPAAGKKPANWLLDAMAKKPDARNDRIGDETERILLPGETESKAQTRERDATRVDKGGRAQTGRRDAQSPVGVPRRLDDPTGLFPAAPRPGEFNGRQRGLAQRGVADDGANWFRPRGRTRWRLGFRRREQAGFRAATGTAGKSLLAGHDFEPATVAAVAPANPGLPVTASPPAIILPLPNSSPAKSKIPEFAKPAADDKYFKQAKRF